MKSQEVLKVAKIMNEYLGADKVVFDEKLAASTLQLKANHNREDKFKILEQRIMYQRAEYQNEFQKYAVSKALSMMEQELILAGLETDYEMFRMYFLEKLEQYQIAQRFDYSTAPVSKRIRYCSRLFLSYWEVCVAIA